LKIKLFKALPAGEGGVGLFSRKDNTKKALKFEKINDFCLRTKWA